MVGYSAEQLQDCFPSADVCVKDQDGELIVAICNELMQRVHRTCRSASEILFIDSTGEMKNVFNFILATSL